MKDLHQRVLRRASVLTALALVWLATGCGQYGTYRPPLDRPTTRVCATQSGQMVAVHENHLLAVHLDCDGEDTRWVLDEAPSRRILKPVGVESAESPPPPCLREGDVAFYFEAVGPGLTSFRIVRIDRSETFELTVRVFY